jgi:hypothetical protein
MIHAALYVARDTTKTIAEERPPPMPENNDDSRYEIRNPSIEQHLRDIGERIHAGLQTIEGAPKMGFVLLLFDLEGDATFYISDCQRADIIKALHEYIRKLES